MMWLYLTLLSVGLSSVAGVLQKTLMGNDRSNPYSYAIVFHLLLALCNFALALVTGATFSFSSENFIFLIFASLLWGVCSIFLFKALQLVEVSEVTVVSTLRVVVTIGASVLFLSESFDMRKMLGAAIIIVSTFLVTDLKRGMRFNSGLVYTLLMALCGGLAIVADSFNVQHYNIVVYSMFSNLCAGLLLLAFYPKALNGWKHFIQPSFLKRMLPVVIFSNMQALAYLFALSFGGNTAQVGTIRQSSVIVTVLLAILFLNERGNLHRKLLAATLVTFGVILLS